MGFEDNRTLDCGSEAASPTVEELISQLRSSFFSIEFQKVAKTLMEREEHMKVKYIKLKTKVEEEKDLLFSKNLMLIDELKNKQKELDAMRKENQEYKNQIEVLNSEKSRVSKNLALEDELQKKKNEIDAMRKLNAEYERKFRVYEKRSLDFDNRVLSLEKIAKELMGSGSSSINLENMEQKNCAAESSKPPSFIKKEDSMRKTEPKLHVIIQIDDDDDDHDDDHVCISKLKGKRVSNETKREYISDDDDDDDHECISTIKRKRVSNRIKREHNGDSAKISPFLEKIELDSSASDSGSDSDKIHKAYMASIAKTKKQKERWEFESDMVKDFEKDDEL